MGPLPGHLKRRTTSFYRVVRLLQYYGEVLEIASTGSPTHGQSPVCP